MQSRHNRSWNVSSGRILADFRRCDAGCLTACRTHAAYATLVMSCAPVFCAHDAAHDAGTVSTVRHVCATPQGDSRCLVSIRIARLSWLVMVCHGLRASEMICDDQRRSAGHVGRLSAWLRDFLASASTGFVRRACRRFAPFTVPVDDASSNGGDGVVESSAGGRAA